ncbi:unnamed protein product [Durusdinium trenchii]|uniref:Uncharacterized protein n=1 Tax=Durusdinium trenchii TaxID=1381693 RepID=A0ABP0JXK5_9DINO
MASSQHVRHLFNIVCLKTHSTWALKLEALFMPLEGPLQMPGFSGEISEESSCHAGLYHLLLAMCVGSLPKRLQMLKSSSSTGNLQFPHVWIPPTQVTQKLLKSQVPDMRFYQMIRSCGQIDHCV